MRQSITRNIFLNWCAAISVIQIALCTRISSIENGGYRLLSNHRRTHCIPTWLNRYRCESVNCRVFMYGISSTAPAATVLLVSFIIFTRFPSPMTLLNSDQASMKSVSYFTDVYWEIQASVFKRFRHGRCRCSLHGSFLDISIRRRHFAIANDNRSAVTS
jgi:hypothetical protein